MKIIKLESFQKKELVDYFFEVQNDFDPPLFERISKKSNVENIDAYAEKLLLNANVFVIKNDIEIIALIAIYTNNKINYQAYIPILSVKNEWAGNGFATKLVECAITKAKDNKMRKVLVRTWQSNYKAISLYSKLKFKVKKEDNTNILFEKILQ